MRPCYWCKRYRENTRGTCSQLWDGSASIYMESCGQEALERASKSPVVERCSTDLTTIYVHFGEIINLIIIKLLNYVRKYYEKSILCSLLCQNANSHLKAIREALKRSRRYSASRINFEEWIGNRADVIRKIILCHFVPPAVEVRKVWVGSLRHQGYTRGGVTRGRLLARVVTSAGF